MRSLIALLAFALPAYADPDVLAKAKDRLAPLDGELATPGLREPVEVVRDRWGVPHIYAKNADDLFFAQGYVAAQDRLFQLDLWRRQAAGEMAEAFGPEFVEADTFARLMKYRGTMADEWASYAPDAKQIIAAFVAGINAAIDAGGDKLPIEFDLLGIKPKKWVPEDVLGRMSGIVMSQNFRSEVDRARLVAAVGVEKARWLAPIDPPHEWMSELTAEDLKGIGPHLLKGYEAATKPPAVKPFKSESNNWVVAAERSASGKPLLASDPHRALGLPSLRYLVHLNAPGWNVIGAGEPALPGVALGHNDRIAWGITIVGVDQADIYVEETDPADPTRYKVGDGWVAMTAVREQLAVKGGKPREVVLRYTRHGPVLHEDAKRNRAYALKWAGHEPGGAGYLAGLSVDRAQNKDEFLAALGRWKVPGLNFVYADVDGHVGWVATAATPVRPKHDGLLPVPGNGGFEWGGYLPVAEYPQRFDPPAGFVATANHNILPPGYKHQIGYEFSPPFRFRRIEQELSKDKKWELSEFKAIQHDAKTLPGLALAAHLKRLAVADPAAKRLTDWDGVLSADSPAGALYALWLKELQDAFFARHYPKELLAAANTLGGLPTMLAAIDKPDQNWFGAHPEVTRDELLRTTFAAAAAKWAKLPTAHQDRWGALHTATFRHPLGKLDPALAKLFDAGPVPRTGDVNTPNNTRYDAAFNQVHGATYRQLFDLADWDRGLATSAPGQSGQPGSPHYADLLPLWAKGEYFPLAFSRDKVRSVAAHTLTLEPKR